MLKILEFEIFFYCSFDFESKIPESIITKQFDHLNSLGEWYGCDGISMNDARRNIQEGKQGYSSVVVNEVVHHLPLPVYGRFKINGDALGPNIKHVDVDIGKFFAYNFSIAVVPIIEGNDTLLADDSANGAIKFIDNISSVISNAIINNMIDGDSGFTDLLIVRYVNIIKTDPPFENDIFKWGNENKSCLDKITGKLVATTILPKECSYHGNHDLQVRYNFNTKYFYIIGLPKVLISTGLFLFPRYMKEYDRLSDDLRVFDQTYILPIEEKFVELDIENITYEDLDQIQRVRNDINKSLNEEMKIQLRERFALLNETKDNLLEPFISLNESERARSGTFRVIYEIRNRLRIYDVDKLDSSYNKILEKRKHISEETNVLLSIISSKLQYESSETQTKLNRIANLLALVAFIAAPIALFTSLASLYSNKDFVFIGIAVSWIAVICYLMVFNEG
ncbi:MAG: hypothetical protein RX316_08320 [bacterium]|nr:hypothetical protein [bacterium]